MAVGIDTGRWRGEFSGSRGEDAGRRWTLFELFGVTSAIADGRRNEEENMSELPRCSAPSFPWSCQEKILKYSSTTAPGPHLLGNDFFVVRVGNF